jgi:hypothetical protein
MGYRTVLRVDRADRSALIIFLLLLLEVVSIIDMSFILSFLTPRGAGRRRPEGPSTPDRPSAKRPFNGPSPARPFATGASPFLTSASATKQASSLRLKHPEPFAPVAQRQEEEPIAQQQESNQLSEEDPSSLTRNSSSRGSATVSGTSLRTPEVIVEGRTTSWGDLDMPEGLPLGPVNSLKGLTDRIETWANQQGFSLSKNDATPASKSRGQRLSFACHRYFSFC